MPARLPDDIRSEIEQLRLHGVFRRPLSITLTEGLYWFTFLILASGGKGFLQGRQEPNLHHDAPFFGRDLTVVGGQHRVRPLLLHRNALRAT